MLIRTLKLLPVFLLLPFLLQAQQLKIDKLVIWQGRVELTGPVQVDTTGILRIAPGTRVVATDVAQSITVQGKLLIEGDVDNPVFFDTVKGWQGINFIEGSAGSQIVQARFRDCAQALGIIATSPLISGNSFTRCDAAIKLLRESSSEIHNNEFIENGLGLGIEMRSAPKVVGNSFRGHTTSGITASNKSRGLIEGNHFEKNAQGVGLLQQYPDKVHKNTFIENRVALYCYQTQNTPQVEDNLFQDNEYGLVNFSFSFPAVRNNRFIGNKTAMQNDQFGSALVENNLFENNDTAVFNNRKSNPKIRLNSFSENRLALFVDYSSYPVVRQNNFKQTTEGARIGIYQSADWEKRSGSKQLVMKNAQTRGSKNAMLGQAPTKYTDIVDLSENWWGEKNPELESAASDQNVVFFYDRKDQPTVTYEGFGPDSYRLDEIRFQPVLKAPVNGTGPLR